MAERPARTPLAEHLPDESLRLGVEELPLSLAPPKSVSHRSLDFRRRTTNVREDMFGRLWEHENVARRGISYGYGILQDLMFERRGLGGGPFDNAKCRAIIRNREAAIVATVVQWLGTNVGWCFLERALAMCGKRIVDVEPGPGETWVRADDRLPTLSGGYLVRQLVGAYVSTSTAQADFLVGTVPGKNGLWTGRLSNTKINVAWWYEPESLKRWEDWP